MLQAQGHGGMAGGMAMGHGGGFAAPHAMAVAHGSAPVAHFSGGTRMAPRGTSPRFRPGGPGPVRVTRRPSTTSRGTTFNRAFDFNETQFGDAPGLGFDETHLRNTRPRDFDHNGRRNRFNNSFFPFYGGGFFLPYDYGYPYDDTYGEGPVADSQPQPQYDVAEEAPEPPHARTHYREPEPPAVSRDVPAEPQAKTEEYVFVRRDGTLFFAVAYTWDKGTLRYITSEGVRRSATSDTLDLGATQQFNEQRGMSFHLPA